METQVQRHLTPKDFFSREDVKSKFTELLGRRAPQFITSVLQTVTQNKMLAKADPASIYQAAAVAATMDLPINPNLGFAYIVPYSGKDGTVAQFQMGYKGFIQLAYRSGQFKTLSAAPIYEGQIKKADPLRGFEFDFSVKPELKALPIGYAAYFALINGAENTLYMTVEDLRAHGTRFSQSFKKGFGLWKDDFDGMAKKTVLKLLLSKYAPLSIDMQRAVITDQSVVRNADTNDVDYVDAEAEVIDKEEERWALLMNDANTLEDLYAISVDLPADNEALQSLFTDRKNALANAA